MRDAKGGVTDFRVTVVMACFNAAPYMREAIDSVLSQTAAGIELIIVDDASSDQTLDIALGYARQSAAVKVLRQPANSGPAAARNRGAAAAGGEWLGVLDADDWAYPSRFEEQLRVAEGRPDVVLVGAGAICVDEEGRWLSQHKYATSHWRLVRDLVRWRAFPPHSSMLYRKSALQSAGGFNPRFVRAQDYDLWLRLSEIGVLAALKTPLVRVRKHPGGISLTEGGHLQLRLACAALVCYFLRAAKQADPSTDSDEKVWNAFVQWVDRRLCAEGVYQKTDEWARVRREYYSARGLLSRASRAVREWRRSEKPYGAIWQRSFGWTLAKRLSEEWQGEPLSRVPEGSRA